MPRFTKGAEDLAVLIQFDDPVVSTVHHPNVLVWCNQQTIGVTDVSPLPDELTLGIEDLDALILAVAHIYAALFVDSNTMRQVEFASACSVFSQALM
jgi:glycyl-tRNA synthetase alpha subunit